MADGGPFEGGRAVALRPDSPETRAIVDRVLGLRWTSRADLVGVQGARAGSGRSDGEFWQAADWFLKSRSTRRFDDAAAAAAAADRLFDVKRRLGVLAPARSVVAVVAAPGRGWQVWTIAPQLVTLRERLDAAARDARWNEFGYAIAAFAAGLGETIVTSLHAGLGLDANPANFATQGARLRYLDDDVTATRDALGIEDAFAARFAEYPAAPAEVWDGYVRRMAAELLARSSPSVRARLGLARRFVAAATLWRGAAPHVERLLALLEAAP
jgi:hypothetical protein